MMEWYCSWPEGAVMLHEEVGQEEEEAPPRRRQILLTSKSVKKGRTNPRNDRKIAHPEQLK
jgi:hypothetical protein